MFWRRPRSCRSLKTLSWKARPCLTLSAHHTPVGAHLLAAPSGSFRPRLPTATLVSLSTPSFHCRARCCLTHRLAPAPQSASWSSAQERLPTLSSTVSLQASDHDLHLRKITLTAAQNFPQHSTHSPFQCPFVPSINQGERLSMVFVGFASSILGICPCSVSDVMPQGLCTCSPAGKFFP